MSHLRVLCLFVCVSCASYDVEEDTLTWTFDCELSAAKARGAAPAVLHLSTRETEARQKASIDAWVLDCTAGGLWCTASCDGRDPSYTAGPL